MSKEIKVGKIIIEIGKKETPLTIDEAKALKAALCELFPEPKQVEHHHTREVIRDNWRPYWAPYYGLSGGYTSCNSEVSLLNQLQSGNDIKLSYCADLTTTKQ
jgi:hypothetical protein